MAKNFLQSVDQHLNLDSSLSNDNKIPTFFLPLPLSCYLPDDLLFIKVKSVKETNPKVLDKGMNRPALIFNNIHKDPGCYLKFSFNTFGIIESITYLGRLKINFNSIMSLVGLHENYLNELLSRYELKLVQDIPEFLSENWAMALFHDNFSKLVIRLKSVIQDQDIEGIVNTAINNNLSLDRKTLKTLIGNISEGTQQKVELEILNFLNENRNHLPYYFIPQLKY